jgi:hypothetical protein
MVEAFGIPFDTWKVLIGAFAMTVIVSCYYYLYLRKKEEEKKPASLHSIIH